MHWSDDKTNYIREFIRVARTVSYRDLAEAVEVTPGTIINYVNGKTSARIDTIEAALNEMGYTLVILPLEATNDTEMYIYGYNKGRADVLKDLTKYVNEKRGEDE